MTTAGRAPLFPSFLPCASTACACLSHAASRQALRIAPGRGFALLTAALLVAGCAGGGGTPVEVATADGKQRYSGERSLGRDDRVALTSETGAACGAALHPTEEAETRAPAAYGGVRCDDGRMGVLLFSGTAADGGGTVEGVMNRRKVSGGWGNAA